MLHSINLATVPVALIIELDDGKIYRKALYLMVKTHGFPVNFPLNQSSCFKSSKSMKLVHVCYRKRRELGARYKSELVNKGPRKW